MESFGKITIDNNDIDRIDNYRRKFNTSVLTILFTDIESSTKLREELGDKGYTELLEKHDSILLPIISEYNGLHIKSIGDSILAVFFQPSDAVECAVSIQDSIFNSPLIRPFLKIRIGIDMGQIAKEQAGGIIKDIFGRFVNRAARIEGLANGGHILCSESVQDNATGWINSANIKWYDHGLYHVKGVEKPLKIWEPFNANITDHDTISDQLTSKSEEFNKNSKQENKKQLTKIPEYNIRSNPITVSDLNYEDIFDLNENLRPKKYINNDYNDNGDGTVTDFATGLMWQKSRCDNRMKFEEVENYISELNSKKFAGYSDWRLPTIEELKSLMLSEKQPDSTYIDHIFDKRWGGCWSSDRWTSGAAWSISFSSSHIYCHNYFDTLFIRVVRSFNA